MSGALAIETRGLTKRYGAVRALDGLDLAVPAGSVFGLVGPNGAGKTTTFSVILGFVRPDAGAVRILGLPLVERAALRGRVLALPQDAQLDARLPVLISLTYLGQLAGRARDAARQEALEVLGKLGLAERAQARPTELSHGMAKRVGVAQALLGTAELLLLDEPTAGLDPRAAADLRANIRELRGDRTVIVSSHNLAEIQEICDHVAIVNQGRVVSSGPMEQLTRANAEVAIELLAGEVPREALLAIAGVAEVRVGAVPGPVTLRFDPAVSGPDDVISAALAALLGAGGKVGEVRKGRGLEAGYLESTET